MKTSKDGIFLGETSEGNAIRVHRAKHDVNGNWTYLVSYFPRNRKIAIQHGASCHRRLPVNLDEFVEDTPTSKDIAEDVVSYINNYLIK